MEIDVRLLADVFENFVKLSLDEFEINPLYCYSLPGFTWLCGLKYTNIHLQYLKDKDLILLLENNIRGGISSVMGSRLVFSNNYQKVIYIDANNLYGWAMSQYLPYDEIKLETDFSIDDILQTPDDNDIGYFIEVDLSYPKEIKEKSKYFPFAPVKRKVDKNELSEYQLINIKKHIGHEKLICDQLYKKDYLVHYRLLKFYVRQGMVISKVRKVISFQQSPWLGEYIDLNTQKRALVKTDFEKDFYKFLNNAFYGKTLENIRNRIDIKIKERL